MAEVDRRADLERRLRIRRRNLERLALEEKYALESEAPLAILERIQAQIRVEQDEVYLLEGQLGELDGRKRRGSRRRRGQVEAPPHLVFLFRVLLMLMALTALLAVVGLVFPQLPEGLSLILIPPTHTPTPTDTPVPPTETPTLTPTATPVARAATSTPPPTPTATGPVGTVNVETLNLRGGPTTEFGIRAKLTSGEQLNLLGRNELGTWLAVSTMDGATGWVAAEYVDVSMDILNLPIKPVEP